MRFSIRSTCISLARTEKSSVLAKEMHVDLRRTKVKALIKYRLKNHACSRPWPLRQAQVRWPTTPYSSLAACIKVLPVLTSTRVVNYSIAAALLDSLRPIYYRNDVISLMVYGLSFLLASLVVSGIVFSKSTLILNAIFSKFDHIPLDYIISMMQGRTVVIGLAIRVIASWFDLSKRTTTKPSNAIGLKSANIRKLQFAALAMLLFVSWQYFHNLYN